MQKAGLKPALFKNFNYSAFPAEPKKFSIISLHNAVIASAPGFNNLRGSYPFLLGLFQLRCIYELLQQILTGIQY